MKNIWVLSVRTSLPNTIEFFDNISTKIYTFEHFEDARDSMRKCLKDLSCENAMFDENGDIKYLVSEIESYDDEWLKEYVDEGNELNGDELTKEMITTFYQSLKDIFNGKDVDFNYQQRKYSDYSFISMNVGDNGVSLYGDYDGPMNCCNGFVGTNAFSMEEEKNYYLDIHNFFECEYEEAAVLSVNLIKAELS